MFDRPFPNKDDKIDEREEEWTTQIEVDSFQGATLD